MARKSSRAAQGTSSQGARRAFCIGRESPRRLLAGQKKAPRFVGAPLCQASVLPASAHAPGGESGPRGRPHARCGPDPRVTPLRATARARGAAPAPRRPLRARLRSGAPRQDRRLCRREPRDRDAEGRAGDVVEADLVAEGDGPRVAAVLAADADLEPGPCRPPALDADADELADAL